MSSHAPTRRNLSRHRDAQCHRRGAELLGWPLALAVLVLVGLAPDARAARGDHSKLPRCLESMQRSPALADYAAYLTSHANVLSAFRPCQFPTAVLEAFVEKLETAELTGVAPSAPLPAAYLAKQTDQSWLNLTEAEGFEVVSAKLAHIFFVEIRGLVPWMLADYDDSALDSLFDVCKQLGCSFERKNKSTGFVVQHVLDHSPREAWDLLDEAIDASALTDPASGVVEILAHARQFRHGSVDLDPDHGIITVREMAAEKVSRRGCWSMSPYVVSLAAALNIPGELTHGYFAGQAHQTALFEAIDGVLAHGDDVYNASLRNTPGTQLLDSYQRWLDDVLRYDPLEGPLSPAGHNSRIHDYAMARLFPSHWTMSRYCGSVSSAETGRTFLEGFFGDYATAAELDDLEMRILEITAGCSAIPRDDPE